MPHTPAKGEPAQMLSHIRYEIGQCFVVPRHQQDDWHLKESVFLAILIHARILLTFFESSDRRQDDVLCLDFGFPPSTVPISADARLRFNKDMVHLTYSRLRHTPQTKPWPVLEILRPLLERATAFMTHVVSHPPDGVDPKELAEWKALMKILNGNVA